MDDHVMAYYSSMNPLARKIIRDERDFINAVGDEWEKLDWQKQEDLMNDFMVDISVREQFADVEKIHSYPQSFPKLKVETGERVNVDFEDDCWTWQDEHSAPFNWRTKSQQDLTLDDLDEEALGKPPSKGKRKGSEPQLKEEEVKLAPREFSVDSAGGSIWESPFLQGMKKPEHLNRSRSTSPLKSTTASQESLARSRSPEEVNLAFSGSMDDLSSSSPSHDMNRSVSVSSGEVLDDVADGDRPAAPPRRRKSSSKSPVKNVLALAKKLDSENGGKSLISSKDEEKHAFDNPALRHEWSSFVNDNQPDSESSSATPSPYKKLLKEPEPVQMDRGDYSVGLVDNQSELTDTSYDFQDEILVVETTKDEEQSEDLMNASSLSKTGFDFLDNW